MATEPGTQIPHSQKEPRDQPTHKVKITPGSRLAETLGTDEIEVNSMHHQAIQRLGRGLPRWRGRPIRSSRARRSATRALRARRAVASGGAGGPLGAGPASLLRARGRGTQILTPPDEGADPAPTPDAPAVLADTPVALADSPPDPLLLSAGHGGLRRAHRGAGRLLLLELGIAARQPGEAGGIARAPGLPRDGPARRDGRACPRWELRLYELTGTEPETFEDAIARFDELDEDQRSARTDLDLAVLLGENGLLERAAS